MKDYTYMTTAQEALANKIQIRSAYLFFRLPNDHARYSYLSTVFPHMPGDELTILLNALRKRYQLAKKWQSAWDELYGKGTKQTKGSK